MKRGVIGPKREEVAGQWRTVRTMEFHNLDPSDWFQNVVVIEIDLSETGCEGCGLGVQLHSFVNLQVDSGEFLDDPDNY